MRTSFLIGAAIVLTMASGVRAQDATSRAEERARQQEDKARDLHTERKGWIERKILEIESGGGFASQSGLFATFGDIKQGSGFALGPAYAKVFNSGTVFAVKGAYSIRNFKLLQASVLSPSLARGTVHFGARARWQDAPSLPVYQLGVSPNVRADYSETRTEVSATGEFRPVRLLRFGGAVGFERYETGAGAANKPRVEDLFPGVPGVNADPDYLHASVSAAIDSRDGDGYSRQGSLLRATLHDYRQQNDGPYSFRRVDGVAEQYVPILHGNWVLYVALRGSTTTADPGEQVPFFLMPHIGGGSDLRGYGNYRFRDRHTMLFTAEYRWYAQEYVDAAIFYDAGKAVANRRDLDFSGLKSDVGVGVRFHGPQTTALRIEVARGREGLRIIFAFSPVGG